ncbi:hypothetical protein NA57DRAFT_53995 [Rhizodiscina lignyota]|uniref:Uncharacterized protein n=1 Tax=Rhizodiscina lignyota TaxID=1504668 RepID=A0A9P4IPW1_9PEZI|nr:hypothetical protein NA57DRAFT_53995 [Rhizodiscina lignyota]
MSSSESSDFTSFRRPSKYPSTLPSKQTPNHHGKHQSNHQANLRLPRKPSEELGEGEFAVRYNKRTGRPIRESAGRRSLNPDYQDSLELDAGSDTTGYESLYDEDCVKVKPKSDLIAELTRKQRKRKDRSPSPLLSPLSPAPPDFNSTLDELGRMPTNMQTFDNVASEEKERNGQSSSTPEVLSLTFNIAAGFQGPLRIEIPLSSFVTSNDQLRKRSRTSDYFSNSSSPVAPTSFSATHPLSHGLNTNSSATSTPWGWPTLPAEIRNRIYHLVFYQPDNTVDFYHPIHFKLSGQFLRTCKQILSEGREILYCENSFSFERNRMPRSPYWSAEGKEIGFKDVRLFLSSIGHKNLSLIRDVTFVCDDAMPSTTPGLTNEERRFVHDPNLIECFRIFTQHGELRSIKLAFVGRRMLTKTDDRFLAALTAIKADEAKVISHPRMIWRYGESKVAYGLGEAIEKAMTRKKKMYSAKA